MIGNEMDLTLVDMEGLLPAAIRMVISVTASTTSGKPLPEEVLQKTIEACDRALALDSAKKKVLDFVETRMGYIAPNLSAIVGSAVAAKLMGTAGGLTALAKMPACNVQLLGAKKKNLAGFSTATSQFRVGYIEQTEVFQSTPPSLRMRAGRLLAAKSTLAARVDSTRGDPSGSTGRVLREEIRKKMEKWQEPPPAKQPKPLPVPDSEPKRKRGGPYAITDMRKLANRCNLGYLKRVLWVMDWGKAMVCLVRLGMASCVFQLVRANLQRKLLRNSRRSVMEAAVVLLLASPQVWHLHLSRGLSSQIRKLMHTNLAVEHKARTFLRMEHFQRSRGPDDAKSYFMDYGFLTTRSYVYKHEEGWS